ncbi:hypothetical protein EGI26_04210 [Lacihabitans sp. CCS-44]|uniref:hypothetical protein n=1 Tax=Lacihabitans sp. CCS-44 TaxID=2487331 RepID=UPI0020CC467E|nr:hypothetical protein [Lacihabitans sp. CCS-44]MCP9754369.1 hypothetical protein [Lacihabitans sp. CCS-44]
MPKKLKIYLLGLICGLSFPSIAQSVVYYPFNSILGLSTNPSKAIWLDVKFQTNSYFSSLSTDISPEINLKKTPKSITYMGAGVKMNYLNAIENNNILEGYFMNFGVRLMPFEKYKKIQLAFEVSPYAGRKFDIGVFRTHFGIGYNFSR